MELTVRGVDVIPAHRDSELFFQFLDQCKFPWTRNAQVSLKTTFPKEPTCTWVGSQLLDAVRTWHRATLGAFGGDTLALGTGMNGLLPFVLKGWRGGGRHVSSWLVFLEDGGLSGNQLLPLSWWAGRSQLQAQGHPRPAWEVGDDDPKCSCAHRVLREVE